MGKNRITRGRQGLRCYETLGALSSQGRQGVLDGMISSERRLHMREPNSMTTGQSTRFPIQSSPYSDIA